MFKTQPDCPSWISIWIALAGNRLLKPLCRSLFILPGPSSRRPFVFSRCQSPENFLTWMPTTARGREARSFPCGDRVHQDNPGSTGRPCLDAGWDLSTQLPAGHGPLWHSRESDPDPGSQLLQSSPRETTDHSEAKEASQGLGHLRDGPCEVFIPAFIVGPPAPENCQGEGASGAEEGAEELGTGRLGGQLASPALDFSPPRKRLP